MTLPKAKYIITMIFALFMISGCTHKELTYKYPIMQRVRVEFDWRNFPEADPEGMCVFFYPIEGEEMPYRRYDFSGRDGGEMEIAVGRYRVICYNNDTETVIAENEHSFFDHSFYTNPGNLFESVQDVAGRFAPRAEGAETQRVVLCPDLLYGCATIDIEVSTTGVRYINPEMEIRTKADLDADRAPMGNILVKDKNVITLYPDKQVCHYSYEIRKVPNLNYVTQMCASISGMAPSIRMAGAVLHDEPVTHPVAASIMGTDGISGEFLVFGHNPDNLTPHNMLLYVWMKDGGKFYYPYDVTEQIDRAPNPRRVHLILATPEIPKPITNGSGFQPSVQGWDKEIVQDVIM